jgi:hypothetical protein
MHYRLLFLGSDGDVTNVLELGCKDDGRALALVDDIPGLSKMELWQGDRLVKRYERPTASGESGGPHKYAAPLPSRE